MVITPDESQYEFYNPESPKIYAHRDSDRILGYARAPKPIKKLHNKVLAGRGNISNEKCGSYKEAKGVFACECGHTVKINKLSCNSHFCPICYRFTAMTSANKIMIRTIAAKMLNHCRNSFHVMISFNESFWDDIDKNVDKYYRKIIDMLNTNKLFDGGSLCYHPYRLQDGLLVEGPHFHGICISNKHKPLPKDMKAFTTKHKLFLSIIESSVDNSIYYNTQDKLLKTIYYELTHSACAKKGKMYRYFGCMGYSKFKTNDIMVDEVPVLCQKCEGNIHFIPKFDIKEFHYNPIVEKKLKKLYKYREKILACQKAHKIYGLKIDLGDWNMLVGKRQKKLYRYSEIAHKIPGLKINLDDWIPIVEKKPKKQSKYRVKVFVGYYEVCAQIKHLEGLKIIDLIENIRFDKTVSLMRNVITGIKITAKNKNYYGKWLKIKNWGDNNTW